MLGPMPISPHTWIDSPAGLPALAEAMAAAPWIALDSEANSMFVYRERMCLLQVNAGGTLFVVDTWTLLKDWDSEAGPSDLLAPLRAQLEREDRPLWLHGGEYDCALLNRDFAIKAGGVWDSQQAASMLGQEGTSYGAVVARICGITLAKAHAQYDWRTRPLDPDALQYALDDVIHLPAICEHLRTAVAEADLVEEVAIANAVVAASGRGASGWETAFDPTGWWRLKGLHDMRKDALPVLHHLWAWRDGIARTIDMPPGRVINTELLLALARHAPVSWGQLRSLGVKARILAEYGDSLLEAVKAAKASTEQLPVNPRHREVDDAEERREKRLKDWRRTESERRKVPLQVVMPAKAVDHLKRYGACDLNEVPQLGAKRIGLYGAKLLDLCR